MGIEPTAGRRLRGFWEAWTIAHLFEEVLAKVAASECLPRARPARICMVRAVPSRRCVAPAGHGRPARNLATLTRMVTRELSCYCKVENEPSEMRHI